MFCKNIQYFLFLDEPFSALPYIFWLIRPDMPFFTGFPGFRGALPAPLLTQPPTAAPTIPRMSPKKIHPWIFFGLQNCKAILHAAKPPIHGLFTNWHVRAKKYIHVFCQDCRIAMQFCMLLSRHPWLFTNWQVRAKNPSLDFLWIEESLCNSSCAKPPSMAFYELASTSKKIHPWIFYGLKNRCAILHALSRHPWLFTGWQVRAKIPPWLFICWQMQAFNTCNVKICKKALECRREKWQKSICAVRTRQRSFKPRRESDTLYPRSAFLTRFLPRMEVLSC